MIKFLQGLFFFSLFFFIFFAVSGKNFLDTLSNYPEKSIFEKKQYSNEFGEGKTKFLSSNNYVGTELLWPNLKKDWKNNGPWIAFNVQASYVRAGFGIGNAFKLDGSTSLQRYGNYKFIGLFYNYPLRLYKNIIAVEPEIGLDFFSAQFRDDASKNPNSVGFGLTPGIGIKIGPAKFVAKYTTSFALNISDKSNAWSGGMNYFSAGLFLETGWGLMSPKRISSVGIFTTISETRTLIGGYFDKSTANPDDYVLVYRVTTHYTDHEIKSTIHDIEPFWYVAPKILSSSVANHENGKTFMFGGELGARVGMLAIDGFYNKGNYGFVSPVNKQDLINQYGIAPDLTGTIGVNSFGAKAGLELLGIITKIFVKHDNSKIYRATRFTRFILGYGLGSTSFIGQPSYTQATGEQQLNNFFTIRPDLKPSNEGIPGKVSQANYSIFNLKFEMGLVSIGYEKHTYKNSPFANGHLITIGYMIPPGRIARKIKYLAAAKRFAAENKK